LAVEASDVVPDELAGAVAGVGVAAESVVVPADVAGAFSAGAVAFFSDSIPFFRASDG
jgi:hypothetical protein